MRLFTFRATVKLWDMWPTKRFLVEADSEPEATYDAKKQVEAWLTSLGVPPANLKAFDLLYSKPI